MKKNIFSFCLLSCFTAAAFAAQCPSASDFTHVKGQPWRLSQNAIAQGWMLSEHQSEYVKNSNFTTLPGDILLLTGISKMGYISCHYYLNRSIVNTLTAFPAQMADVKSLSLPPFYYAGGTNEYLCETTPYASAVCQWKWTAK